jgi:O-Antigen ligase
MLALVLPVLFVPSLAGEFWLPRYALLPLEAVVGLCLVVCLLRTSLRIPALLGLAFAAWATLSTLVSPDRAMALWGEWLWGTGLLFVLALVGMWGIGAFAGRRGAQLIEGGLVLAAAINALVALTETMINLTSIDLGPFAGRAVGLWGNPVWLGAFLAGALWIGCTRYDLRPAFWGALVALLTAGIQVSGSRSALAVVGLIVVVVAVRSRWQLALQVVAWILAGFALGLVCTAVAPGGGSQSAATSRVVGQGSETITARLESWSGAAHAIARRPLVGEGPGRYGAATGPFRSLKLARQRGPERLFLDAHDFIVEYATTTGLPGLLLLLAFLAMAVRRAGPFSALGGFAVAVLLVHLLEPQNPGLTTLATLALGAAATSDVLAIPLDARPAVGVLALAATVGAGVLLVGGWYWQRGVTTFSLGETKVAEQLLPRWPEAAKNVAAEIQSHAGAGRAAAVSATQAASVWAARAVADDQRDETSWSLLGTYDDLLGHPQTSQKDFRRALALNPWSTSALNGLGAVAAQSGDTRQARQWWDRSLLVAPGQADVAKAEAELRP